MAQDKAFRGKLEDVVVAERPQVLHYVVMRGLVVCVYHSPGSLVVGGAFAVGDHRSEKVSELVRALVEGITGKTGSKPGQLQAKLVGSSVSMHLAQAALSQLGVSIAAVREEKDEFEIYFYTDSGRLRLGEGNSNQNAESRKVQTVQEGDADPNPNRRRRVLIVDDSKTIRQLLSKILSSDPGLEVVGAAERPSIAERMIEELKPDVITLDIHMPEMSGVDLLSRYIKKYPIPTVMISSLSMEESNDVLRALETGAVDYIQKPSFEELDRMAPLIIEKVRTAAHVRLKFSGEPEKSSSRIVHAGEVNRNLIVAVGASTGGTEALRFFFTKLPSEIPPIVVVQHIPPVFSRAFANRLAELCPFEVKEAEDGDEVLQNRVLIAPGGLQMVVENRSGGYRVKVFNGEPVNRHKPSVDVLFDSVAKEVGRKAIGIIMTGMGRDGAAGMLKMRQAGARTIAQDEASCVVFGMPKEAIRLGGAEAVESLDKIPETFTSWIQVGSRSDKK